MKKAQGFTLIELIAVIVILSILAVTAVPQFLDLRNDARAAVSSGVGGSLASATTLNYAKGVAKGAGALVVTSCTGAAGGVGTVASGATGLIPAASAGAATSVTVNNVAFTIGGSAVAMTTNGASQTCTISDPAGGGTKDFTITACLTVSCS